MVFSAAVGPGAFFARTGSEIDRRSFSGASLSFELLLGAHAGRTFSFGGAYLRDQVFALSASDSLEDGDEVDADKLSFFTSTLALFGDLRLLPQPELHLQGFLGYGNLYVHGRPGDGSSDIEIPGGFVYAIAATLEYRLSESTTIGGAFRLTMAPFSVTETNLSDVSIVMPTLLAMVRFD